MSQKIIIVSGMSGAGIGSSIKFFGSSGCFSVQNIPVPFLNEAVSFFSKTDDYKQRDVAIGVHFESSDQVKHFLSILKSLKEKHHVVTVGLSANNTALISRFDHTRRRHPWKNVSSVTVDLLNEEREAVKPFLDTADFVIDTSGLLERELEKWLSQSVFGEDYRRRMVVSLVSFGFKYGAYYPLDILYDARFLRNPYFVAELRSKTGLDLAVKEFFKNDEEMQWYIGEINRLHQKLIPKYSREGKNYLRIGVGCTGGRHRSVYVVENLLDFLKSSQFEMLSLDYDVLHRDIGN